MIYGTHDRYAIETQKLVAPRSLDDLPHAVEAAVETLRGHLDEFDSIVVMGMSGVLVGVPAALQLGVPVVVVRKENDSSHSYRQGGRPEGLLIGADRLGARACFVDDFISMGATRRRVAVAIATEGCVLVSQFLYGGDVYERLHHDPANA